MGLLSRFARRREASPEQANPRAIGLRVCLQGLRERGYTAHRILDVGAAEGHWALAALEVFPQANLFLIEALEERRPMLESLRSQHGNLDFEITGAGPHNETMEMGITTALDSSSFAYPGTAGVRPVPVRTIDSLFEQGRFAQPDFLKLDVQGFELQVLEGAPRVLAGSSLVLLELNFFRFYAGMPLVHDAIDYMVARGLRPYEIVDVLRRPLDGAMGQCDMLFCREGHALLADSAWQKFD